MKSTIGPKCLLLVAALLLGGCESVLFASLNLTDPRSGIVQHRGLVFDAAHHLELDVYAPAHAKHAPVVVFFYGGSWTQGEREWYRFVGTDLAARGVVTIIPDYRKIPAVPLADLMQDAADAVSWTYTHAAAFGGNPQDVFVMGHSAGGHIGALLVTDAQWLAADGLQPIDLAGFIGLAGVYAFLPEDAHDDEMLAVFGYTPESRRRAEPVRFVDGTEPAMLLLQGGTDDDVDPANSFALAEVIKADHGEVELKLYPDIGHAALLLSVSQPLHKHAPTLHDILVFIHAHPHASASLAKQSSTPAG